MATADVDTGTAPEVSLEGGTYEILRNRLGGQGRQLRERLEKLNAARKEVFGSIDTRLLATERITTEHNCVPRDMVAVGNRFLFGYNVHFGLKTEFDLADVFAVYEFRDHTFHEQQLDLIRNAEFEKHFKDLYRYYKNAVFAKFFVSGPHLYIVFRVGKSPTDIKTFKWAFQGDRLVYLDNRSDHEVRYPPQHEFEWVRTTRDMQRTGAHPHISIDDRVFVETVGGDLTIKVENNTDSGEGIYAEPVENRDQTLDDAEIWYATVGNVVLLKIRPYQERAFRYIIYNEKIRKARRLDAIEHSCVLLPDDHGLIFPNGYYLQNGEHKTFESAARDMLFERRINSPNGEDYLYVFYNRLSGLYILLRYNLIEQKVDTPLVCNGFTFFQGGELICFKCHEEPQKHHPVQIWQTPYVGENYVPHAETESYLYRIGNRDIVRGMAECHELLNLLDRDDAYAGLYIDLTKLAGDIVDSYYWIDKPDAFNLKEVLVEIRAAAQAAIEEFEKVVRVRRNTAEQTERVQKKARDVVSEVNHKRFEQIDEFVSSLAGLRTVRGEIVALRDLRYVDNELVDSLEKQVAEESDRLARRCVNFLLEPDALTPYERKVQEEHAQIEHLTKVADARKIEEAIDASATELEMLIEIVGNLNIEDATQRTAIIDGISAIFTRINQARAALKTKHRELFAVEGVAEFNSQMKLLNQGVVNYLDVCDTPEKCEEYLTRVMIQLEELEGRFAEFDEFIVQLSEKREEIYNAFESRKVALLEARNKRAGALMTAAERILKGIKNRVEAMESINDIHAYYASDLMIERVRDIVRKLGELNDTVKVDDIQSRLKTIREDAVRQLKDRQELFVDGKNVIRFGSHQFTVSTQALDLTTILRDGAQYLHLTGTNYFEKLEDERLVRTRDVWDQEVVSENREVYRAEYLAYLILSAASGGRGQGSGDRRQEEQAVPAVGELAGMSDDELLGFVGRFMGPRYSEGYVKGVHDHDAARILRGLLDMKTTIGLLRYHTRARALAHFFWQQYGDKRRRGLLAARLRGFGTVVELFPGTSVQAEYVAELRELLLEFVHESGLFPESLLDEAAEYLFHELAGTGGGDGESGFAISRRAVDLIEAFHAHLERTRFSDQFQKSVKAVHADAESCLRLLRDWVGAFLTQRNGRPSFSPPLQRGTGGGKQGRKDIPTSPDAHPPQPPLMKGGSDAALKGGSSVADDLDYLDEVALLLLLGTVDGDRVVNADVIRDLGGLVGSHPVVEGGNYHLHYNRFMLKLAGFERRVVPRFLEYTQGKKEVVEQAREQMKLDEFRPQVLTAFVRNRLIDSVYLPLIGDNLAKQMGVAGEQKRTDRMGMLLLISPPGYGKTTLMEYIANRLGLIFMKINGPAIGHQVTSLDPTEAPNAAARDEVNKLNLALEMGDNVMIYLDDIQHCNPELLQKFISLCDAQRKIEGVWKGRSKTYDLRGRKVAVVMAGNPYTESGEKFQIPDMLANRADVYNLGEIIGDAAEAFELSYLENSLTSNPVLSRLAARSQKDVYGIVRMAEGRGDGVELEGNYPVEEINEFVAVMRKLMQVRDIVLKVNREYIRSAAQADDYRTEPAFKLQGSYRNMNRIAERVFAIMNDAELRTLIVSAYENDAQTLTTGTEANLLKFKEIMGILTDEERQRWEDIKKTFQRNVRMRSVGGDDKLGLAIVELSSFRDGLDAIRSTLTDGIGRLVDSPPPEPPKIEVHPPQVDVHLDAVADRLGDLRTGLQAAGEALSASLTQALELARRQPLPTDEDGATKPSDTRPRVEVVSPNGGDRQDGGLPHTITVVNKIPPTLLNVLQRQFELMEGWMRPLLATTDAQRSEIRELKQLLEDCLDDYARLVGRIREARQQSQSEG